MITWQIKDRKLEIERPLIMGIVNATPDSFSDSYPSTDLAFQHAMNLVHDGADILDVGGESTRPGSDSIAVQQEIDRVVPLIQRLRTHCDLPISIDTQKPEVAEAAVGAGASIINHVSAGLDFKAMTPVLKRTGAGYVAMHMPDRPKTMQASPNYVDVLEEVTASLAAVGAFLAEASIASDRILYDPGIGFGKTLAHNLTLMASCRELAAALSRPLLMGISRKSWLSHFFKEELDVDERDMWTLTASLSFPFPAAAVHRVHQVAIHKKGFKLAEALHPSAK